MNQMDSDRNSIKSETGATMVEYAVMVALIAAFCWVAVSALGVSVSAMFISVKWW